MSTQINNVRIALRHDTLERWTQSNPLLLQGEYAAVVLSDSSVRIKIGDGVHNFNELPYEGQYLTAGTGLQFHNNVMSVDNNVVAFKTDLSNYYTKDESNQIMASVVASGRDYTDSHVESVISDYYLKSETSSNTEISDRFDNIIKIGSYLGSTGYSLSSSDLSVVKISEDDYIKIIADEIQDDKVLYVVSSDNLNARNERVVNVAEPMISSDAATKGYVDSISAVSMIDDNDQVYSNSLSVYKISRQKYIDLVNEGKESESAIYVITDPGINAYNQRISCVADPVDVTDAANKKYVDNLRNDLNNADMRIDAVKGDLRTVSDRIDGIENSIESKHILNYDETNVIAEDEDGNEFMFTIFTKGLN